MLELECSTGNQRLCACERLDRLTFIWHARELRIPRDAIRGLLRLADNPAQPCDAAEAIAQSV